jgi:hypothetical protein
MLQTEACSCGARFVVGFLACPRCKTITPRFAGIVKVRENAMPKMTVAGGPSNAGALPGEPGHIAPETEEHPVTEAPAPPAPEDPQSPADKPDAAPHDAPEPAPDAPDAEPAEELTADDEAAGYTDLSFAQLRAAAKARNIPATGTAVELAARLAEHDQTTATEGDA